MNQPVDNINTINSFDLMKKRTKIIATIGPATETEEAITKLIESGVNIIRFNTKHNTFEWHKEKINLVRTIAHKLDRAIGVLVDLQGPDVRVEQIKTTPLILNVGETITISDNIDNADMVFPTTIVKSLEKNQKIAIDDGKFVLTVIERIENVVKCVVVEGGEMGSRKGAFFPGLHLDIPALSDRDIEFIPLAAQTNAEFCALSFVRTKEDVLNLRAVLDSNGAKRTNIISKIETLKALENIDEIIELSDVLMVARGDLGVEVPMEAVPSIQKKLIKKMIFATKPIIVATQMLKSMIESPLPTRAEISDIANAAFESSDCVMLSEETAIGKYYDKAVSLMAKTIRYNEMESQSINLSANIKMDSPVKAIVAAADEFEKLLDKAKLNPRFFIVLTSSGNTAKLLSSTRPGLPIYAFCHDEFSTNLLTINWGVKSFRIDFEESISASLEKAAALLIEKDLAQKGDMAIVISGQNVGHPGHTDSIRYYQV